MSNSFGSLFKLTTYGESHGEQIGGIIDGCPANITLDLDFIQSELDRRKPGQSSLTTTRKESDIVHFHSGIFEGKTTGTPIAFSIKNKDQRSKDYSNIKEVFRPSHADFTYQKKYGIRDYRGGGRSSARETACRVVAGAVAKCILQKSGIQIRACVDSVYQYRITDLNQINWESVEQFDTRAGNQKYNQYFREAILEAQREGNSLGGSVYTEVLGLPVGLGEPVFDKFQARLGYALLGINAVKGFEIGKGFLATEMKGSEHNDAFEKKGENIHTKTNHAGGVLGGITNGEKVYFRTAFKPTATILKEQNSVNTENESIKFTAKGRHDACVLPRAVVIVEAMAALVCMDFLLLEQSRKTTL
ncbi:MAG: chorismate synthase [Flavobacteriales bacterium]|jgi:chorismate synthase|nr:chorismate synthase [Flavobacteriales bacterium]